MAFATLPADGTMRLVDVSIPACLIDGPPPGPADGDGVVRADLDIRDGRIAGVERPRSGAGIELGGAFAFPGFVDLHTHLDKGHIWPRIQNPDGSFMGAINAVIADRQSRWSEDDIRRRFEFGLRCALAHGTVAIRTHIDSYPYIAERSFGVFAKLREAWAGRIALQAASITPLDQFDTEFGPALADIVARSGAILGAVTRVMGGGHEAVPPEFTRQLATVFRLAEERGLDLDLHVDESGETGARALGLIARMALERGFKGRIVCGHCCSLAIQPDDVIDATLDLVKQAGIAVVSLPMCNLYLQDRTPGRTPRWRGVTLLHEMAARGIPVSVASDNCRDPFYGFGDHDMLEVFREAVRIAHLDRPYGAWPGAVARGPADAMGLPCGRIAVGAPADLVLFRARRFSELLSRHQADRVVLRDGRPLAAGLPDYRELDDLMAV